jgi:hypothetical protein
MSANQEMMEQQASPVEAGGSGLAIADAVAKLQALSPERAAWVVALIEDLADLEVREDEEDLAAVREAEADGEEPILWEEARARLNAIHGID